MKRPVPPTAWRFLTGDEDTTQAIADAKNGKGGKGKGIPFPVRRPGGRSRGNQQEKVELQDEDPTAGSREFRKDVMDAMKQGAPDRYKDQNKKYYEELVK